MSQIGATTVRTFPQPLPALPYTPNAAFMAWLAGGGASPSPLTGTFTGVTGYNSFDNPTTPLGSFAALSGSYTLLRATATIRVMLLAQAQVSGASGTGQNIVEFRLAGFSGVWTAVAASTAAQAINPGESLSMFTQAVVDVAPSGGAAQFRAEIRTTGPLTVSLLSAPQFIVTRLT